MKATAASATGNADVSAPMLQYARWWWWKTYQFIWRGVVLISWMVAVILLNAMTIRCSVDARARWWASGGCSDGGGEASGIIHQQWAVERLPEWRLIIAIVFLVRGVFGVREYAPAFPWWECLCLCRLFVEINGKGLSNLIYIHKSFILCKSFQGESVFLICLYFPVFFPHKPLLSIYYFG